MNTTNIQKEKTSSASSATSSFTTTTTRHANNEKNDVHNISQDTSTPNKKKLGSLVKKRSSNNKQNEKVATSTTVTTSSSNNNNNNNNNKINISTSLSTTTTHQQTTQHSIWKHLPTRTSKQVKNIQKKLLTGSNGINSKYTNIMKDTLHDDTWRKDWRGIHLPPSFSSVGISIQKKGKSDDESASGEVKEENEDSDESNIIDDTSKGISVEEDANEPTELNEDARCSAVGEVHPPSDIPTVIEGVQQQSDNLHQLPSSSSARGQQQPTSSTTAFLLFNYLFTNTNNEPSIPISTLLILICFYLILKHILLRKIFTYKQRTRLVRAMKCRISNLGGNYKQFVLSQQELEEQIDKLKKRKMKRSLRMGRSSGGNRISEDKDDDTNDDGDINDNDYHEGGGGENDGTSFSTNNGNREGDNNQRNGGQSNNNNGGDNYHHSLSNDGPDAFFENDQTSYLKWMHLTEEVERSYSKIEQLSSDVVVANERCEMIIEALNTVRVEKNDLVTQLEKQKVELQKAKMQSNNEPNQKRQEEDEQAREIEWMKMKEECENALKKVEQLTSDVICANEALDMVEKEKKELAAELTKQKDQSQNPTQDQEGEMKWMELNEELETSQQKVEQLSADLLCANENAEMLGEQLSKVKREKEMIDLTSRQRADEEQATLLKVHKETAHILQQVKRLTEENEMLKRKVDILEEENEKLDGEMENLVTEICDKNGDVNHHLEGKHVDINSVNTVTSWGTNDDVVGEDNGDDECVDGLRQELDEAMINITSLTEERNVAKEEAANLSMEVVKLRLEKDDLARQIKQSSARDSTITTATKTSEPIRGPLADLSFESIASHHTTGESYEVLPAERDDRDEKGDDSPPKTTTNPTTLPSTPPPQDQGLNTDLQHTSTIHSFSSSEVSSALGDWGSIASSSSIGSMKNDDQKNSHNNAAIDSMNTTTSHDDDLIVGFGHRGQTSEESSSSSSFEDFPVSDTMQQGDGEHSLCDQPPQLKESSDISPTSIDVTISSSSPPYSPDGKRKGFKKLVRLWNHRSENRRDR